MRTIEFPSLCESDVEVRVSSVKESYIDLLLYKNARVDMRILDQVVGPMGWERHHEVINDALYCTVSIKDDDGEWVSKQDCGTAGEVEKDKGSASDAFKRACFNWGIGRELYTIPAIRLWTNDSPAKVVKNNSGKLTTYDKFLVSKLVVEDHIVKEVLIKNQTINKVVYHYDISSPQEPKAEPKKSKVDVEKNKAVLRLKAAINDYAERTGKDAKQLIEDEKKRDDYEDTADFYNRRAEEFENGM